MSHALVLDTNILVSAGLKAGTPPALVVESVLLRRVPIHVCPSLTAEYHFVLARPKFRHAGFPPLWFPRLLALAFQEPEPSPWPVAGPDPSDTLLLALAEATGAVLVTGNLKDFPASIRRGVIALSPAAYLERYRM